MGFLHPGLNISLRTRGKRNHGKRKPASEPPTPTQSATPSTHPRKRLQGPRASQSRSATPPILRAPAKLETLPTELIQKIFLQSLNPALAATSLALCRKLATVHLQREWTTRAPESALRMRFFTTAFLAEYEQRCGPLRLDGCGLPARLLARPFDLMLARELVLRGAHLEPDMVDTFLSALHDAVVEGRVDVAVLLINAGLNVDTESLRLAVDLGHVGLCRVLVENGANIDDVNVWRRAIAKRRNGDGAVLALLLEIGTPPGEVLGELS